MGKLYKRRLQLVIGKLGSKGVLLEGLRVSFDIDMDDEKETNTGKINIYNLSEGSLGYLEEKDVSIILKVGYGNEELNTLFIGNVIEYEHDVSGVDIITKITLKDGYIPLTSRKLSLSFSENSNTKQILEKIVGDLNLAKGDYSYIPNYVYKQGFSFIGSPGTALDNVLNRIEHRWTIVNNVLIITRKNESNKKTIAQFLSPETGLIDKPIRFKEKSVKVKVSENESVDGWKIRSLLIPSIQPKNLIKVSSSEIEGIFLVRSVKFVGDTESESWMCEIEAIQKQ